MTEISEEDRREAEVHQMKEILAVLDCPVRQSGQSGRLELCDYKLDALARFVLAETEKVRQEADKRENKVISILNSVHQKELAEKEGEIEQLKEMVNRYSCASVGDMEKIATLTAEVGRLKECIADSNSQLQEATEMLSSYGCSYPSMTETIERNKSALSSPPAEAGEQKGGDSFMTKPPIENPAKDGGILGK